ncbi:MAG: hypothetical protein U1E17_04910 [Geminicoccaceae bacterium]
MRTSGMVPVAEAAGERAADLESRRTRRHPVLLGDEDRLDLLAVREARAISGCIGQALLGRDLGPRREALGEARAQAAGSVLMTPRTRRPAMVNPVEELGARARSLPLGLAKLGQTTREAGESRADPELGRPSPASGQGRVGSAGAGIAHRVEGGREACRGRCRAVGVLGRCRARRSGTTKHGLDQRLVVGIGACPGMLILRRQLDQYH